MKLTPIRTLLAAVLLATTCVTMHAQKDNFVLTGFFGAQVKDDLFDGTKQFEKNASGVTEVNLDPRMLGMIGPKTGKDLANKMEFIVVHSYEYDKPGQYNIQDLETYRKRLTDGNWNCFIHSRDKDSSTDICQRTSADNISHELVIMTAEPKELTFVHLKGRMTIDDLRNIGGSVGGNVNSGSNPSR